MLVNHNKMKYFLTVPNDITEVIYSKGVATAILPRIQYRSTISVVPNVSYSISVQILHHQAAKIAEKINKIMVDGLNLGKCEPENTKDECVFSSCANINDGTQTIISETGEISVIIEFEGHSTACHCDVKSWICSDQQKNTKQIPIVAAGRIMLKKRGPFNKGIQLLKFLSLQWS